MEETRPNTEAGGAGKTGAPQLSAVFGGPIEGGRVVYQDSDTARRAKALGDIGEGLAEGILVANGFTQVRNLNRIATNCAYGDVYGVEGGVAYVISVKARNKYEHTRDGSTRLNSRYKLGASCQEHARDAELRFRARAAWLVIALEPHSLSAYFGLLTALRTGGVPMSAKAVKSYRCLARDQPHGLDYTGLRNVYRASECR